MCNLLHFIFMKSSSTKSLKSTLEKRIFVFLSRLVCWRRKPGTIWDVFQSHAMMMCSDSKPHQLNGFIFHSTYFKAREKFLLWGHRSMARATLTPEGLFKVYNQPPRCLLHEHSLVFTGPFFNNNTTKITERAEPKHHVICWSATVKAKKKKKILRDFNLKLCWRTIWWSMWRNAAQLGTLVCGHVGSGWNYMPKLLALVSEYFGITLEERVIHFCYLLSAVSNDSKAPKDRFKPLINCQTGSSVSSMDASHRAQFQLYCRYLKCVWIASRGFHRRTRRIFRHQGYLWGA